MELPRDGRDRRRAACRRAPFRLPVQWVNRPDLDFRGFAGHDRRRHRHAGRPRRRPALGAGRARWRASSPTTATCELAVAGQSVTLTLDDEIDVSRGDVIAKADDAAEVADQFEATIVWMADEPMLPGRELPDADRRRARRPRPSRRSSTRSTSTRSSISPRRSSTSTRSASATSSSTGRSRSTPTSENRETGGFILIDRITNDTVGAGLLHFALRRVDNVHWQAIDVDKTARVAAQRPERPASSGSRASRAPASRRSPTSSRRSCTRSATTPTCSTATTSATASTRTSASPTPTASRTSAASARSRS